MSHAAPSDSKSTIEVFIQSYIRGHFHPISPSRVRSTPDSTPITLEFKQELITASLILQLIQTCADNTYSQGISTTVSDFFGLTAFLVEHFRYGNCTEQAAFAAKQLAKCTEVDQIIFTIDQANNHAYLQIKAEDGSLLVYDPWLISEEVFTPEEDQKKSSPILTLTPYLDEYQLDKIELRSHSRSFSGAFCKAFTEVMLDKPSITKKSLTGLVEEIEFTDGDLHIAKERCHALATSFLSATHPSSKAALPRPSPGK